MVTLSSTTSSTVVSFSSNFLTTTTLDSSLEKRARRGRRDGRRTRAITPPLSNSDHLVRLPHVSPYPCQEPKQQSLQGSILALPVLTVPHSLHGRHHQLVQVLDGEVDGGKLQPSRSAQQMV